MLFLPELQGHWAAGRAVESPQTEGSPETATTVPLPGTVPAAADTWEMRWVVAGKKSPLRPQGAWYPERRQHLQRRYFGSAPP